MKVKIKKFHPDAVIPKYAMPGDAGMDLTVTEIGSDNQGNTIYYTGIGFEIPEGYVGLIFPRSSNSKTGMLLSNSVGVIDSGYRGQVTLKFKVIQEYVANQFYKRGDRVGQIIIIPYPQIEFEEVEELSATERGISGYGSTDNKIIW